MTEKDPLAWDELKTAALVGLQKRNFAAEEVTNIALSRDLPQRKALEAAALLGSARSSGFLAKKVTVLEQALQHEAVEHFCSADACQLLEAMLLNKSSRNNGASVLLAQWFQLCAEKHQVLPHRLLVNVLTLASKDASLRDEVAQCLGNRGRWLAAQNSSWQWVQNRSETFDTWSELTGKERIAYLQRQRKANAAIARNAIVEKWEDIGADVRLDAITSLDEGLSLHDESLLTMACNDSSKRVKNQALLHLDALPISQRAQQLGETLAPLLRSDRKKLHVAAPASPTDEQKNNIPTAVAERYDENVAWLVTILRGAPLQIWEQTLGKPEAIIKKWSAFPYKDELLYAVETQKNQAWAEAIFVEQAMPAVVASLGPEKQNLINKKLNKMAEKTQDQVMHKLQEPWNFELSKNYLKQLQNRKKPPIEQMTYALTSYLHADCLPKLLKWQESLTKDDDRYLNQQLRYVCVNLSTRTSLEKVMEYV